MISVPKSLLLKKNNISGNRLRINLVFYEHIHEKSLDEMFVPDSFLLRLICLPSSLLHTILGSGLPADTHSRLNQSCIEQDCLIKDNYILFADFAVKK